MARRIYLFAPSALVFAVVSCGGASDPGLFSGTGGGAGNHGNAAGASNHAGSPAMAGDGSTPPGEDAGATVGGAVGVAGQDSGGSNSSAGSEAGGTAGSAAHAGAGGSTAGSGGGNAAGAGGSSAGAAGSGGSVSTEPTCKDLYAKASTQLEAARACNVAKNVEQCTGTVKTTCNCEVPVESEGSAETQAYEATLKQINQKKCTQVCPAIVCLQVTHAQCRANSADTVVGTCVSNPGVNF